MRITPATAFSFSRISHHHVLPLFHPIYHIASAKLFFIIEIRDLRKAIWAHVPGRDHSPIQIYTHGDDQYDLLIHGDVTYEHHHGHQTGSDWAAKAKLVEDGGKLKVKLYQIIVVSVVACLTRTRVGRIADDWNRILLLMFEMRI